MIRIRRYIRTGRRRHHAFTLVELMISVSILAIGIVLILRGLIANASALGSSEQRVEAMQFLASRMWLIEEAALQDKGISAGQARQSVTVNGRTSEYRESRAVLEAKSVQDELYEVILTLSWDEGGRAKDASIAGYFLGRQ